MFLCNYNPAKMAHHGKIFISIMSQEPFQPEQQFLARKKKSRLLGPLDIYKLIYRQENINLTFFGVKALYTPTPTLKKWVIFLISFYHSFCFLMRIFGLFIY